MIWSRVCHRLMCPVGYYVVVIVCYCLVSGELLCRSQRVTEVDKPDDIVCGN